MTCGVDPVGNRSQRRKAPQLNIVECDTLQGTARRSLFGTRAELERAQEINATVEAELEDTRKRVGGEMATGRESASESLQRRNLEALERQLSRFKEQLSKSHAYLRNERDELAGEKKNWQDVQVKMKREIARLEAELRDATEKLQHELKDGEALKAELDEEKERRKRVVQLLTGEWGLPPMDRALPRSG